MKLIIVSLVLTLNKYLNVRTNSRPGIRTTEKNRTKMLENFFKVNEKKKEKRNHVQPDNCMFKVNIKRH